MAEMEIVMPGREMARETVMPGKETEKIMPGRETETTTPAEARTREAERVEATSHGPTDRPKERGESRTNSASSKGAHAKSKSSRKRYIVFKDKGGNEANSRSEKYIINDVESDDWRRRNNDNEDNDDAPGDETQSNNNNRDDADATTRNKGLDGNGREFANTKSFSLYSQRRERMSSKYYYQAPTFGSRN